MRKLTNLEINNIHGAGCSESDYSFSFIVSNTVTGAAVGVLFPNVATSLGLTAVIANPILATGALFGTYAAARLGASALDSFFKGPAEQAFVAA